MLMDNYALTEAATNNHLKCCEKVLVFPSVLYGTEKWEIEAAVC